MHLGKDEFSCFGCHKVSKARAGSEEIVKTGKRIGKENREQYKKVANCERCNAQINKFLGVSQKD